MAYQETRNNTNLEINEKHKLGVDSKQIKDSNLLAKRSIEDTVFPKSFS